MAGLDTCRCACGLASEGEPQDPTQSTQLLQAIKSGNFVSVESVLSTLRPWERRKQLAHRFVTDSSSSRSMLPIFHAAKTGNLDIFLAIHGAMEDNLTQQEVSGLQTMVWRHQEPEGYMNLYCTPQSSSFRAQWCLMHTLCERVSYVCTENS